MKLLHDSMLIVLTVLFSNGLMPNERGLGLLMQAAWPSFLA